MLLEIVNDNFRQAKRYVDPSSIFHTDIDEALQRITLSISILKDFLRIFHQYKDNLAIYFKEKMPQRWTFHSNTVFERYQLFLDRLHTIQVMQVGLTK